jgi:hypothetical protein
MSLSCVGKALGMLLGDKLVESDGLWLGRALPGPVGDEDTDADADADADPDPDPDPDEDEYEMGMELGSALPGPVGVELGMELG